MFWTDPKNLPAVTDLEGKVVLPAKLLFDPEGAGSSYLDLGTAPLVVVDERRDLIGLEEMPLSDFGSGKTREVRLQPACHITSDLTSFELSELGEDLAHTEAYAARPGKSLIRAFSARPATDRSICWFRRATTASSSPHTIASRRRVSLMSIPASAA